jgi:hypothetical protein
MAKVLYFLLTILESGLALFGFRATQQQPSYRVIARLTPAIEVRAYESITVAETASRDGDDRAFSRLFAYITGANTGGTLIKMTVPVEKSGADWADPEPGAPLVMRFFLPAAIAADPPPPRDPRVHIVTLPARTIAAIRFSGSFDRVNLERHLVTLREALARAGRKTEGVPFFLGYDPPFTIPALRRNEVAIAVDP